MSVVPKKRDITIYQGASYSYKLRFPTTDLTNVKARMQVRTSVDSTGVLVELTTENGRISIDPIESRMVLSLTPSETAGLRFDRAVYDLEIEFTSGDVWRVLMGSATLSREVTR